MLTQRLFLVAAARAMQGPKTEDLRKPFYPIVEAFASYPSSSFTFILGKAIELDETTQMITIKAEKEETIHYDSLIIATGTTSKSPLWTLHDSFTDTISAFEEINTRLTAVQLNDISIAGGGAVGVEVAGELGYRFKKQGKTITLLSGTTELLPRYHHEGISQAATSQLSALGVKIIHNLRVISSSSLADGKTELNMDDGSKRVVDLFVDTTGGLPNTSFLPNSWLDSKRKIVTETTTLRTTVKNVYAIGDVASFSRGTIMDSTWSIPALCYSIFEDLSNGGGGLKVRRYKQITSAICFIPIGAKGGVGAFFGWQLPSFVIWMLKSRDFMIGWAPGVASGM